MSGYIGTQPVPQATQTRDAFTATAGQTSFATRGYTPNFLDVYLNGVKLAAADYTATNGSDVVLASGAVVNDILEVVAYTAFDTANVTGATNFTVTGAFTSQGIDDNGNATALTIDSSENVLFGTTDDAPANNSANGTADNGFVVKSDGVFQVAKYNDTPAYINRTGNDGTLIDLRKSGTTVGSIGTHASNITIGTGATGLRFFDAESRIMPRNPSTGANVDGTVSLGEPLNRFKDIYLSGGVYLGGTGAANKLDDVETGTWTPTITGSSSAGTMTYPDRVGRYQKVGRLVTIHFYIQGNSGSGSGNLLVGGVPFTIANYHLGYGSPQWNNGITYPSGAIDANYLRNSSTTFDIRCNKSNAAFANVQYPTTPDYLRGCITYETTQ